MHPHAWSSHLLHSGYTECVADALSVAAGLSSRSRWCARTRALKSATPVGDEVVVQTEFAEWSLPSRQSCASQESVMMDPELTVRPCPATQDVRWQGAEA